MSAIKSQKDVANALRSQLVAYADLSYASDSGYVGEDVQSLVQYDKFPFFNIDPIGLVIEKVPNMDFDDLRRNVFEFSIIFAQMSVKKNIAINGDGTKVGIMDFAQDLINGVLSDPELGKVVYGIPEDDKEIAVEFFLGENDNGDRFEAGGEFKIKFYIDLPV